MVGSSPEPMVRLRDGVVISRPIAGSRPRGRSEHEDELAGRAAVRGPQGAGRARDAGRPGPQRRRPGGPLRDREGRRVHDRRALQPHHAPDLPGVGRAARGTGADRRAAGHAAGRDAVGRAQGAGHGDHRRARADQARHLRRGRRLPRLLGQPRHGDRHPHDGGRPDGRATVQAGAGIVADSDPETEDAECAHKAAALLAAVAAARAWWPTSATPGRADRERRGRVPGAAPRRGRLPAAPRRAAGWPAPTPPATCRASAARTSAARRPAGASTRWCSRPTARSTPWRGSCVGGGRLPPRRGRRDTDRP